MFEELGRAIVISTLTLGKQKYIRKSDRHLWVQGGVLGTGRISYS